MQTKPLKYSRPTRNTAFSIPEDVLEELEKLCRMQKVKSKSELVTELIHQAHKQCTDPDLALVRMRKRKQDLEKQREQLEREAVGMYGRSLDEQLQYIEELRVAEEREARRIQLEQEQQRQEQLKKDLILREKRPLVQATLTEFYKDHRPDSDVSFVKALRDRQLIDVWQFMGPTARELVLNEARKDAGWQRNSFGHWKQLSKDDEMAIYR